MTTYPLYLAHSRAGEVMMLAIGSPILAAVIVIPALCLLALLIALVETPIRAAIMRLTRVPVVEIVPDLFAGHRVEGAQSAIDVQETQR